MGKLWIVLVLVAQFAWAIQVYLDKWLVTPNGHDTEKHEVGPLVLISAFFGFIVAPAILVIMWIAHGYEAWEMVVGFDGSNIFMAMAVGAFEVLWLVPYFYALHETDETVAPPLFQTVPLFGFALGYFVFDEIPTALQVTAGVIILIGALVLNLEAFQGRSAKSIRSMFKWKPLGLMLLSSFIIAFSAFVFKDAALNENFGGTAFWMAIGAALTGVATWLVVPSYRREFAAYMRNVTKKRLMVNCLNEVVNNLAMLAFYWAVVLGPSTALVQTTVAYQPVLLLIFGFVLGKFGSRSHADRTTGWNLALRLSGTSAIVAGSLLVV